MEFEIKKDMHINKVLKGMSLLKMLLEIIISVKWILGNVYLLISSILTLPIIGKICCSIFIIKFSSQVYGLMPIKLRKIAMDRAKNLRDKQSLIMSMTFLIHLEEDRLKNHFFPSMQLILAKDSKPMFILCTV